MGNLAKSLLFGAICGLVHHNMNIPNRVSTTIHRKYYCTRCSKIFSHSFFAHKLYYEHMRKHFKNDVKEQIHRLYYNEFLHNLRNNLDSIINSIKYISESKAHLIYRNEYIDLFRKIYSKYLNLLWLRERLTNNYIKYIKNKKIKI